jgi:hypothetical protein
MKVASSEIDGCTPTADRAVASYATDRLVRHCQSRATARLREAEQPTPGPLLIAMMDQGEACPSGGWLVRVEPVEQGRIPLTPIAKFMPA